MTGIVVVSHSRALARAAIGLAAEMLHGDDVRIVEAAGLDETTFGTDATAIMAAVEEADDGTGVVVLMDLGSAVMSAELALDLLDPQLRDRVVLSPAPLVEGLAVAAVAAAGGAGPVEVAAEAASALDAKQAQLGAPVAEPDPAARGPAPDGTVTGEFEVTNPHGLHARPAASLVREARAHAAAVELRNVTTGSGWVAAASLSKVATLGALRGHTVAVRGSGRERPGGRRRRARRWPPAGSTSRAPPTGHHRPRHRRPRHRRPRHRRPGQHRPRHRRPGHHRPRHRRPGNGRRHPRPGHRPVPGGTGHRRRSGFPPGVPRDRSHRRRRRRSGGGPAALRPGPGRRALRRRARPRRDRPRRRRAGGRHLRGAPAPARRRRAAGRRPPPDRGRLRPGPGLAGRRRDGGRRLRGAPRPLPAGPRGRRALGGDRRGRRAGRSRGRRAGRCRSRRAGRSRGRRVLDPGSRRDPVADDLTPAQVAALDPARVRGIVLAAGSPTGHSAILARARGIPTLVGAGEELLGVADGTVLAMDGTSAELVVDPAPAVIEQFERRAATAADAAVAALATAAGPAVTTDGVPVLVGANLGSLADAERAAGSGADLAGLVRTEFLFLGRTDAPDVDEQVASYRALAEALGGRRLTLRTLDVGGDKPLPYAPQAREANPFLGVRGIRFALAQRELLATQLTAIAAVAHETPISVMFPMVSTLDELAAARHALDAAVAAVGRGVPAGLQVGIMVEVPAAALRAASFVPMVDFLSIGTNDLTQYALAAERGNPAVAALADPLDPAVLALVDRVCRAAAGSDTLVAVCGEVAADENAARLLVGMGVRELSVAPPAVPAVKQAIRGFAVAGTGELVERALAAPDPATVRRLLAGSSTDS